MSPWLEPFRRLKWGFLPQKRIILENPIIEKDENNDSTTSIEKDGACVKQETKVSSETCYEYRDECNRKWWKFFDEYEYRVNNSSRENKKWYKWFHQSDTSEERRVILKLDILLSFYSVIAYWIKSLDQNNLTNAYIGGLKEDIGMTGNDFINTQVMFSVGNIVFQIPFIYVLYACPLNYVLTALDIIWSILTICLSRVTNVNQLKVLRFFIGAAEAPSYLAYHSLFASWFKSSTGESSRRAGFYFFGQYLGMLTSGLLSGAIERNLGGVGGYTAWQWIFIMDGIISIIAGFIGFYMIPGTPEHCYSAFLSDNDILIARKRMVDDGKKRREENDNPIKDFFDLDVWKTIFSSWHIYILSLWNILCWNNSSWISGAYALWLKSLTDNSGAPRYSPGTLQDYTALTPGLGLLWLAITCGFADFFNSRWGAIIFSQAFNVLSNVLLAVWNIPERAKWFAFCIQYFGWAMAPVLYSWQGDICRRNLKERNVVLVTMNILAQQSTAWTSVLVWKTVEAPRFLKGFSFTATSAVVLSMWTMLVLWFYKREERQNAKENGIILYNSAKDPEAHSREVGRRYQVSWHTCKLQSLLYSLV